MMVTLNFTDLNQINRTIDIHPTDEIQYIGYTVYKTTPFSMGAGSQKESNHLFIDISYILLNDATNEVYSVNFLNRLFLIGHR